MYTKYNIDTFLMNFGFMIFFSILLCIFLFACKYKIYKKAGQKGWKALIPIYNTIILLRIVELPTWYILLYIIPIVNIYVLFKSNIELAHKFGKSVEFGISLVFFPYICLPILAFDDVEYNGGFNNLSVMNEQNINSLNFNTNNFSDVGPIKNSALLNDFQRELQNTNIEHQTFSSTNQVEKTNTKFCPVCGKQLDQSDTMCFMCGHKF